MTPEASFAWEVDPVEKHEYYDGEVFAMSPERVRHAEVKAAAYLALRSALNQAQRACFVLPDGVSVRIDQDTVFEPDALVYCGARAHPDATEITDPVIVVEVQSPSTRAVDSGLKLARYFSLASVMHYLIVDPVRQAVVHHYREGGGVGTELLHEGTVRLDPPGLELAIEDFFEAVRARSS